MSLFLDILRCVLCCVEDNEDENENASLYRNPSWRRRDTPIANSVYDFKSSSSSSIGYVTIPSHCPPSSASSSSYKLPQPEKFVFSSRPTQAASCNQSQSTPRPKAYSTEPSSISSIPSVSPLKPSPQAPKPVISSSTHPQSLKLETHSAKLSSKSPVLQNFSSKPAPQAPRVSLSASSSEAKSIVHEISFTKPSPVVLRPQTSTIPYPQEPSRSLNLVSDVKISASLPKPSPSFCTTEECSSKIIPTVSSSSSSSSSELYPISSKSPTSFNPFSQQTEAKTKWVQKNTSHSKPSPSIHKPIASSSKSLPSSKPILAPASMDVTDQQTKASYVWVKKNSSPIYMIPKDIQDLFEKDEVPQVLERPLSQSTYKDYFHALLYAEDFYIEKWSDFELKNIALELHKAEIKLSFRESFKKDEKTFIAFKIDSSLEKRPFLLSRDFVFARPSGSNIDPFQGIIYRVVKSTTVLVEFDEDFYYQHYSTRKYDVSFSFNRVCLKRAHQAIEAASNVLFRNFIFPDSDFRKSIPGSTLAYYNYKLDADQMSAVRRILTCQGPPPYLIEGPLCAANPRNKRTLELTRTGLMVKEAVLEIHQSSKKHRILLCAPLNNTCDLLTRSLKNRIPESDMFRANAAFREIDMVPDDVLLSCQYESDDECFSCPQLEELQKFRVVLSTYVSSFRLGHEGMVAGHFSHIFLLDASSATEPEVMVALSNLANGNTTIVVTGAPRNRSGWVRSNIARNNGLTKSYFERLRNIYPYNSLDPKFITQLESFKE